MVPLWRDAGAGVEVARLRTPADVEELVGLFEKVASEEGWQPGEALRMWKARSTYFGVQMSGHLAGGLQLVRPDSAGTLPCQLVWPEVPVGPSGRCAHVAVLALDSAYRGQPLLFWRLAVEMWRHCVGEGIAKIWLEVTPRVLPLYQRLGWPLQIVGERRVHWGEACYLCTLGMAEVAEAIVRRAAHSEYYRQIVAQAFRMTLPAASERRLVGRKLASAAAL